MAIVKQDDYRAEDNRAREVIGMDPIKPGSDDDMVFISGRPLIRRGLLCYLLEREPVEYWAVKWGVSKAALVEAIGGAR